ncbi:DUF6493 family protein [Actinomadura decatromicini]|uniref:DUF7824 domain-containing protein n=1 Tax=Actinomadura decatromicini TaxID=2604572 RepID=A0A5D3FAC1_9ACTN|nr:DUF6493 family protein [Actinomadura decatromicini]TYK45907.1 hypothetical protein FXF68_27175 [Actinomadura decatromicini]
MSERDDIRKAISAGDVSRTAGLVRALGDDARRAVAKDLSELVRSSRDGARFGVHAQQVTAALLVAGAGTISGPAAAATWLNRRDLQIWWWAQARIPEFYAALGTVTAARPDEWRADVGRRLAGRVRPADGDRARWEMAAALIRSAGAAPPVSDGFVVGWVVARSPEPEALADDPFLDTLVPALFEANGVGAALAEEVRPDPSVASPWAHSLAALARAGRLDRAALLDGCVSRFLRGGTARELRWFGRLHDALEPTDAEVADRVRDYVHLLPAAPSTVADLALREVRRADDRGLLDAALFEDAAGALLFRPEKKLVRAGLTWLDRTARRRDRVDATLRALLPVFDSDALDLRERAVKSAAKHAALAGDAVRAEVRDAAAGLPADLRETIAAAFGEVGPADAGTGLLAALEPLAGPPPFVPRPAPAPIGSLAELTEEFAVLARSRTPWAAAERFLGALVEFAYLDFDATRKAIRETAFTHALWITQDYQHMNHFIQRSWVFLPVRRLIAPRTPSRQMRAFAEFLRRQPRPTEPTPEPDPTMPGGPFERFLWWRRHEAAAAVGKVPVLLATPTEGSGHVDPGVLVRRLERLEEAGAEPGRADLTQALLRVPRDVDQTAAARAKGLASEAGRTVASWLATGGLADPPVECRVLGRPAEQTPGRNVRPSIRTVTRVDVPGDSDIARLCRFPEKGRTAPVGGRYIESAAYWPSVLPSHREIAAAHLVPEMAGGEDADWNQGSVLLDLAEADGPAGAATGTLLACALVNRHERVRADATEALLTLAARDALPAAETGTALGRLTALGRVTLPRAVKALTAAADAGAQSGVWTVLAAALPHLLPAPGERAATGVPDLLALATRTAESTGARGAIAEVAEVAGRGGSSRLVKEAARLHRTLAT